MDLFEANLDLLDKISTVEHQPLDESEEHLKNNLRDFLRDTYYKDVNAINTKDKKDLVIHIGKSTNSAQERQMNQVSGDYLVVQA